MDITLIQKTLMKLKGNYLEGNEKRIEDYISKTKKRTFEFVRIDSLLDSLEDEDKAETMACMAMDELEKYFHSKDKLYLDYALLNLAEYVIITESRKGREKRRCRICGCTDDDCRQCIEKTGEPCYWVEEDLCSACAKEDRGENEGGKMKVDEYVKEVQTLVETALTAEEKIEKIRDELDGYAERVMAVLKEISGDKDDPLAQTKYEIENSGYENYTGELEMFKVLVKLAERELFHLINEAIADVSQFRNSACVLHSKLNYQLLYAKKNTELKTSHFGKQDEDCLVRCNWCESVFYENHIKHKEDGEYCPVCGETGYLMDMPKEEETE